MLQGFGNLQYCNELCTLSVVASIFGKATQHMTIVVVVYDRIEHLLLNVVMSFRKVCETHTI